jgi:hypothetical protein
MQGMSGSGTAVSLLIDYDTGVVDSCPITVGRFHLVYENLQLK